MVATLQDVVAQLKNNQKAADQTNKNVDKNTLAIGKLTASLNASFASFFQLKKTERLNMNQLEAEREARNAKKSTFTKNFEAGEKAGQGTSFDLGGLFDIGKMIAPMLAAIPLAIVGMRGWEVPVIKKLTVSLVTSVSKLFDKFSAKFVNGITDITRSVLKSFGIDPSTGKMLRDARGRFTGKELKSTSVMISEAFDLMRSNVTKAFGVGTDGGKIGRVVASAGKMMSTLLSPLVALGNGITSWASGAGAKLLGFMNGAMGISGGTANLGKFASFIGKVLKPIGFLFSAYEGVMAFMDAEGSFMDRFIVGIGTFIGDFVGAPLDLLKSIVAWGLEQLGFENAKKLLEGWSFETIINDMIQNAWTMVKGIADWVGLLFTDPGAALTTLWEGIVGVGTTIGQWVYNTAIAPIWGWFKTTFSDTSAFIKTKWDAALGSAKDLGTWIWNNSVGPLWDWLKNTFSWENIKKTLSVGQEPTGGVAGARVRAAAGQDVIPGKYKGGSIPYGKFGVVGEQGPELVAGPVNVIALPKKSGSNLQQEQYNLTQSQNRRGGGMLMANSGNVVNNSSQSNVTFASSGMPSPFDRPVYQSYQGHGAR